MNDKTYPPLPNAYDVHYDEIDNEDVRCYSEQQMRTYVDADRAQRVEAPRGTDAQILREREITAAAIMGAMMLGYQEGPYPPEDSAWLRPFYEIGQQIPRDEWSSGDV